MASPSSSNLQPSKAGYVPVPTTIGQGHDQEGLAAKIERQRAKIVALEHEAEERRRREARQAEDRRVAKVKEREQRQLLVRQQEEQRRRDGLSRDESAMQAHLRHKATEVARKA
jgi:predicted RNase H-like nuclease (RuvC/YqgF family)